jgi:hypothetical protein
MTLVVYENICNKQQVCTAVPEKIDTPSGQKRDIPAPPKTLDRTIHDFRSSLNVIMGYSELMLDGAMGDTTREQRESLKDILTSSQQMLDMLNDASFWHAATPGLRR